MEAVINALTNGKDYSNGAIRWDGFDLAARGFNHPKPKTAGVEIIQYQPTGRTLNITL